MVKNMKLESSFIQSAQNKNEKNLRRKKLRILGLKRSKFKCSQLLPFFSSVGSKIKKFSNLNAPKF